MKKKSKRKSIFSIPLDNERKVKSAIMKYGRSILSTDDDPIQVGSSRPVYIAHRW